MTALAVVLFVVGWLVCGFFAGRIAAFDFKTAFEHAPLDLVWFMFFSGTIGLFVSLVAGRNDSVRQAFWLPPRNRPSNLTAKFFRLPFDTRR